LKEFAEKLRILNELANKDSGHSDIKAVIVWGNADVISDHTVKEYCEKGYKIIDENMFGAGTEPAGTVVVLAKD